LPRIASCSIEPCPYLYDQHDLMETAVRLFQEDLDVDRYAALFETSGIRTRRFVAPVERLARDDGWLERSDLFAKEAARLGEAALESALEASGLHHEELGHLFFISTSGIAAPSVDARILGHPPWNPGTHRTPVWGLGCAGGISGMARAADWVRAHPSSAAAVLTVEFCSLTFMPGDRSLSNFVAAALFADGVACAVVVGDELAARKGIEGFELTGHRVRLFQDSIDVMGWNPVEQGLQVVFSRRIPSIVREHAGEEFHALAASSGVEPGRVTAFLGHPGGPKVLRAYAEALDWPEERFRLAWSTLSRYGNLSSASILHVLAAAFEEGGWRDRNGEYVLLAALGPGFSSEQLLAHFEPAP
jgi:alkylresorcinol/alkylpyrone synthase